MTSQQCIELFNKSGKFCRTGDGTCFVVEIFLRDMDLLSEVQKLWGGNIFPPPPSDPKRWIWRVYGKKAEVLWDWLKNQVNDKKRAMGDRKLLMCTIKYPRYR